MNNNKNSIFQFKRCAQSIFQDPQGHLEEINWSEYQQYIGPWYQQFVLDLWNSKNGYALHEIKDFPYTQELILKILTVENKKLPLKYKKPILVLTHDVDYLFPTIQLWLKLAIGRKKLSLAVFEDDYLSSLEHYLKLDQSYTKTKPGTLFISLPEKSSQLFHRPIQWLIDPSYQKNSEYLILLKKLLKKYECEIGIHGSFFSMTDNLFSLEKKRIEDIFEVKVQVSRQHWLNIPDKKFFHKLSHEGIHTDSTLGWNGRCGFRCGMAHPFPIVLEERSLLTQMPMLLMDGPLFDDMKLSTDEVCQYAINLLTKVKQYNGVVTINWHERTASKFYQWDHAYQKILQWAQNNGFEFSNIEGVNLL